MTEQDQVSEVTEVPAEEATPDVHPTFNLPMDHPLILELGKVRREAASTRDKKNKAQDELAEKARLWEEHENSQKTEMQRLAEAKQELETKLSLVETDRLRQKIMNEFKLDAEDEEFITGNEEEMRSKAEKLSKRKPVVETPVTGADTFLAGNRGTPVKSNGNESDGARFLKSWF